MTSCFHSEACCTFHHFLKALPHDVDVVDVVELIHQIAIVVGALIALSSCPVSHRIDLKFGTQQQWTLQRENSWTIVFVANANNKKGQTKQMEFVLQHKCTCTFGLVSTQYMKFLLGLASTIAWIICSSSRDLLVSPPRG